MKKRKRSKWSKEQLEWSKKCHGVARSLFGTHRILIGDRKLVVYDYYIKEYIRNRFGKESRRELTQDEWEDLYMWLRSLRNIRERLTGRRALAVR